MWKMCEFHDSNGTGFGDIWWTYKFIYFKNSSINNRLCFSVAMRELREAARWTERSYHHA